MALPLVPRVLADTVTDLTKKHVQENQEIVRSGNQRIEEAGARFGEAYKKNLADPSVPYSKELDSLKAAQSEAAKAVQAAEKRQAEDWRSSEPQRTAEGVSKLVGFEVKAKSPQDSAAKPETPSNSVVPPMLGGSQPQPGIPAAGATGAAPVSNLAPPAVAQPAANSPSSGYTQSGAVSNPWGGSEISNQAIDGSNLQKDLDFPSAKKPELKK